MRVLRAPRSGFSPTALPWASGPCAPHIVSQSSFAASPPDDTIVVRGNRRIEAAVVRGYFHAKPGGALDEAAVNDGLKALYASGLFADVKVAWSGTRLVVTVAEAPVIDRVQFEGNKQFKDKELTGEIRSKAHTPLTKAGVQDDVARIAELYRHTGRYDATITPKTIVKGEGRVDLVFEIKEGPKTGIAKIVFIGNHAFSDQRLKGVIKTSESGWLAFLKTTDVYDADRLEIRPRPPARLLSQARLCRCPGGGGDRRLRCRAERLRDRFHDRRGRPIPVRHGRHHIEYRRGRRRGAARGADDVERRRLRRRRRRQVGRCAGAGGEPAGISVRDRASPARSATATRSVLDLVLAIDDGPHTYIERIVVRGNTSTQDQVIRREFDIHEGDAYNKSLVVRAERRLKALNLFKSVKTSTEPGSSPDRVVLDVEIGEEQTGEFYVSGGYSTSYGMLAEVTVAERNFMGLGQYVKVSGSLGQYVRSGKLSFAQPYFLDTRSTLGLDLFGSQTLTNSNQSYGSTSYGSAVRIDAPVTDTVSAEARYSIVNQCIVARPGAVDLRAGHRLHVRLGGSEAGGAQRAVLGFDGGHQLRLLDPRQSRRTRTRACASR